KEVTAVYWKTYQLSIDVQDDQGSDPGANIHLEFDPPATASQAPDPDGDYGGGQSVTLYRGTQVSATPNDLAGYQFDHWTDACSGTGDCSFTMNSDATLGAVYWKWVSVTLNIEDDQGSAVGATLSLSFTAPSGAQQSNAVPSDGSYGNDVIQVYRGATVTADPDPFAGYNFDHWTGACTGTGDCSLNNIQTDKTLGAVYWKLVDLDVAVEDELGTAIPGCKIDLQFDPPATASQAPDPDGLYGNGAVVNDIYRGTTVTPTEQLCGDYRFDHWELDGVTWSGNFVMNGNREIKAVYWLQFLLQVSTDPVSPAPGRVDPITGSKWVDRGKVVALKARNFAGYFFDHWELDGKDAGTGRTLYVKMDSDHTVIAHFYKGRILRVYIEPNPRAGIVRPGSGVLTMRPNELVTLEARPFKGYVFDHWEVDGSEAGTEDILQLRMSKDHVVVAYFRPVIAEKPPASMKEVGFPSEWKYYATPEDEKALGNLSEKFAGESLPGKNVVLITTAGKKFADWERYSVRFVLGKDGKFSKVRVLGHEFEKGMEKDIYVDYAVVLLDFRNNQIVVSGITTRATKAALMWLFEHPEAPSMGQILVIKWADTNGNGLVEKNEVFLAYGISG
ncbi:MAG: hypothetical protein QI199_03415, partial [Candidatus Korarchaeota archaeon]|nr:hypothetical protein [Candidatus Korarchaeota archaeon]